jgi:hypothetical protein
MVGHTGNMDAVITSVEAVDLGLARLLKVVDEYNITLLITADHGNADEMFEKNKKGEVVNAAPKLEVQLEPVKHIDAAINMLLGFMIAQVKAKCVNLNESECKAVAACLAINNSSTVIDLINSDLPVTADLFDIILAVYGSLDNIMRDVLLLEKTNADLPTKLSTNQAAFVDSLKRWVYRNLQGIPIQQSYQFLVATYGAINNIDISNKLINLRDCGNQYPNIVELNKQLFVK